MTISVILVFLKANKEKIDGSKVLETLGLEKEKYILLSVHRKKI